MGSRAVATVLLQTERARVEAAGQGCYRAWHGESLDDAVRAVRRGAADALFLSVHRCAEDDLPRVARFVREFPHVPAVALISRADAAAADRVLRLGASGVHAVVDVSAPAGWHRLRTLVREPATPVAAAVLAAIAADLEGAPYDCRLLFEYIVRHAPELGTARRLARALRTPTTSLTSRFLRAGLPSPKTYLTHARLLHAAWLFSANGLVVADVAHRLDYSSAQAFGRHVRAFLGVTAAEFRRRVTFDTALARFRARFLTPFRDRLLTFHPLGTLPGDHGHAAWGPDRRGEGRRV
jgi:AraC-like DNA-binding protein